LETAALSQDTAAHADQAEQAKQQLKEVLNGPRSEDIRKQRAAVAEDEADLAKLINGPLPEEIAEARGQLAHAQAQYDKVKSGSRPEEIAQARAAERNANAKLAQMERGLTPQERAEAKARLDQAISAEDLAKRDAERYDELFKEDAVSKQQADQKQTDYTTAKAKRHEMEEAWNLADTGTPKEEMDQARQEHKQAQAALDLLLAGSRQEDIDSARADLAVARKALQLELRGSRSEDIAAARARLASAKAALDELVAGSRREDIRQSQAAAAAAQSTAKSARINLEENTVISPIDAVVDRIPVAVGDLVSAGTTVVRLTDPTDIWLRVYVPEANLKDATVGTSAKIKLDGIPELLDGVVESVSSQGEFTPANLQTPDDRGKQVFGVRLRLKKPDLRVKAGMAATVKQIGGWTP
jgi:multidrug resistance efflux pump